MNWIATSDRLPTGPVLVHANGECYLAELVGKNRATAGFIELHTSDLLPWPSHWMPQPAPPANA